MILDIINQAFGSYEKFEEVGIVNYTEDSKIEIGIIKDVKTNRKIDDFKKKIVNMDVDNNVSFKEVDYSTSDLVKMKNQVVDFTMENLEENRGFDVDVDVEKQKITLSIENLTEADIKSINTFVNYEIGKIPLEIKGLQNQELPEETIARVRNWTKLGGGISINNGTCSTTGVGKKGSDYFLITAGHCIKDKGTYMRQNNAIVGVNHTNGVWNNIDVGLIRVTNDNTLAERRASNYFYKYAQSLNDYDARISGVGVLWQNTYLCKSGITSDVTCGSVIQHETSYRDSATGNVYDVAKVRRDTKYSSTFAKPGDSGSIVYDPNTHAVYGIVSGRQGNDYGYVTKIQKVIDLYSDSSNAFTLYTSNSTPVIAR